jgi:hypothetical protein
MKKRVDKNGDTDKLIPRRCEGYRVGEEVLFASNHQELVMVDKAHIDWPQCNACYKEAYKIFSDKNFGVLNLIKKPKKVRDANIILNYLESQLESSLGNKDVISYKHDVVACMHVELSSKYIELLEEYYGW